MPFKSFLGTTKEKEFTRRDTQNGRDAAHLYMSNALTTCPKCIEIATNKEEKKCRGVSYNA